MQIASPAGFGASVGKTAINCVRSAISWAGVTFGRTVSGAAERLPEALRDRREPARQPPGPLHNNRERASVPSRLAITIAPRPPISRFTPRCPACRATRHLLAPPQPSWPHVDSTASDRRAACISAEPASLRFVVADGLYTNTPALVLRQLRPAFMA